MPMQGDVLLTVLEVADPVSQDTIVYIESSFRDLLPSYTDDTNTA